MAKKASTGPAKKKKFGGKTFNHVSCHKTKSVAKKTAKEIREKGGTARVVGKCVYKGPKSKAKKGKKK